MQSFPRAHTTLCVAVLASLLFSPAVIDLLAQDCPNPDQPIDRRVDDLPPFAEYSVEGRTCRYFSRKPLYPFGHGPSNTRFTYKELTTSAETLRGDSKLAVRVNVAIGGKCTGDEVVQLDVQFPGSKVKRSIKQLAGYLRLTLQQGETRSVEMQLRGRDMAADRWAVEPGAVRLPVGASSADIRVEETVSVGPAPASTPSNNRLTQSPVTMGQEETLAGEMT